MNARIADLIREGRADEITDAVAEGDFFQMQTFSQALIEHVLSGAVDSEIAANASTNRHDFLVSLEQAIKRKRAADRRGCRRRAGRGAPGPRARGRAGTNAAGSRAGRGPRPSYRSGRADAPCAGSRHSRSFSPSPCSPAPRAPDTFAVVPSAPFALPGLTPNPSLSVPNVAFNTARDDRAALLPGAPRAVAAGRRHLRNPVAGARGDQQGRIELGSQHGPELGRGSRLDAVHARARGFGGASMRTATASPIPWNPTDAVFSAARYLAAAGGTTDLYRGVYAYNHADWYVKRGARRSPISTAATAHSPSRSTACSRISTPRARPPRMPASSSSRPRRSARTESRIVAHWQARAARARSLSDQLALEQRAGQAAERRDAANARIARASHRSRRRCS